MGEMWFPVNKGGVPRDSICQVTHHITFLFQSYHGFPSHRERDQTPYKALPSLATAWHSRLSPTILAPCLHCGHAGPLLFPAEDLKAFTLLFKSKEELFPQPFT